MDIDLQVQVGQHFEMMLMLFLSSFIGGFGISCGLDERIMTAIKRGCGCGFTVTAAFLLYFVMMTSSYTAPQPALTQHSDRGVERLQLVDEGEMSRFIDENTPFVLRSVIPQTQLLVFESDEELLRLAREASAQPDATIGSSFVEPTISVRVLERSQTPGGGESDVVMFQRHGKVLGYKKENITFENFLSRYNTRALVNTYNTDDELNVRKEVLYAAQIDLLSYLPGVAAVVPRFPLSQNMLGPPSTLAPLTMYMGAGAPVTQLHYDSRENLVCVVAGGWKKFVLVDPIIASAVLYSHSDRDGNTSPVPLTDAKAIAANFSMAKYAHPITVTLHAGDCLYLPLYWYHTVSSAPQRTISVNYWRVPSKLKKEVVGRLLCGSRNKQSAKKC
eukprot:m.124234 g.124234  ORF g.124234 m.124234 type:complete len:389 (+) comp29048_c0_seq1:108-1274(+)